MQLSNDDGPTDSEIINFSDAMVAARSQPSEGAELVTPISTAQEDSQVPMEEGNEDLMGGDYDAPPPETQSQIPPVGN